MNRIFQTMAWSGMGMLMALAGGCVSSTIAPMRAMQRVEYVVDVPVEAATAPATAASASASAPGLDATGPAATEMAITRGPATSATATAPATQPMMRVTKVKLVDPNQTARFVYAARYDRIWQESMALLVREGYRVDRQDYREGVLTTMARPAAHEMEFWRDDWVGAKHAAENTINTQRRTVRITIKPVEGKPDYYEVATQVLVEREDNPSELLEAPVFVEGSGFGRNGLTLQSDFLQDMTTATGRWRVEGHDLSAEKQILDQLFKRI